MNMILNKPIVLYVLFVSLVLAAVVPTRVIQAQAIWPEEPPIESPAAVVMDVETGTILYNKDGETPYAPASITKIMTALLAIENCELSETVTFSRDAVYSIEFGSSSISRDEGEQMTMEECLYGLMLESANECANAIAEHVSGDKESFIQLMNEKAVQLGCKNTHFANPHGLYQDDHYTCAYDMALISQAAYQNPTFAMITGTKRYSIPPTNKHSENTPLNNHHAMLNYYQTNRHLYDYCVGGKTGYTTQAQSTLVTYAKKGDVTLVCVIMHTTAPLHYTETRMLLDYYFDQVQLYPAIDYMEEQSDTQADLSALIGDINPIQIDPDAKILLPMSGSIADIRMEFIPGTREGGGIGSILFHYGDRLVGNAQVYGKETTPITYPFHNVSPKEGGSEIEHVQINPLKIIMIVTLVVLVIVVAWLAYKKTGEVSLKVRRWKNARKKEKVTLPKIRRTRSGRRRRRKW